MPPRALILRAPGTNCDVESAFAFQCAGALAERLHINRLLENSGLLREFQILCLPGGFSYGDDLGAGRILGNQIRHHLFDWLHEFKAAGKLVLGICNGFQILTKSGILLETAADLGRPSTPPQDLSPPATLTGNASGKFEDRWVRLRVSSDKCVFFAGIESMYLPVAHAEGRFVARDQRVLAELEAAGQLALKYAPLDGGHSQGGVPYPDNPNGAMADVAGVCDATGRVCGLMPHPERHIDPTQHPRWTRGPLAEEGDGLRVFRNAVRYFS
ncbi:MAG TPA: phosphoribosylformylglycinamidine synthase subunit PurQ [Pirellulales bacterium]|nr:phosphoribosylformylglycinamidine synthase subunit PurQ [Pirellulales bacterium]